MMDFHHDISVLYVSVNALRILFYIPQIKAIARCPNGAVSNCLLTWGYFALSHWIAVVYFIVGQPDSLALSISVGNALAVSALVATIYWKRQEHRLATVSVNQKFQQQRK
jgi:hypothetical protein